MNKSKIKGFTPNGQWRDMYKFDVTLEDGTEGTAFSKSETFRFEVGEPVEYVQNEKGNLRLNKQQFFGNTIEPPKKASYSPPAASNAPVKGSYSQQDLIIRQVALKAAVDYGKDSGAEPNQILQYAEQFNAWIIGETPNAHTNHFDDGHPF